MEKNIFSIIRGEITDFLNNSIEVVPGYTFNQYNTIKRCHLYINGEYEDKTYYQGKPKIFNNLSRPTRDVWAKFLNVDTKDIKAISNSGPSTPYKTLLAQKELDYYLKKNDFAQKFNDMADRVSDFGSVVIKKTKKGSEIIDLRRFFLDPTVENIQESRFVTTKYLFTTSQLKKKVEDGWDESEINKILDWKQRQMNTDNAGMSYEENGQINMIRSTPYIEVYERFGEIEEWMLNGGQSTKLIKALFIVAEPMSTSKTEKGDYAGENGGTLFKSEWKKEYPFDECHLYKTPGRWLGIGPVELLFPVQVRINELANQKRISMELSTMHLFQTSDKTMVSNILTDLQNGDVITTSQQGALVPIVNEERNLAAFQSEEQYYLNLAQRLTFVSNQAAGEPVPSSTPATNAVLQNNNTVSIFNFRRQNFTNFIRRYLNTFVLPGLLKDMSKEHILRFVGDYEGMTKLTQAVATSYANEQVKKLILDGKQVTPEMYQMMIQVNSQSLKSKNEIFFQMKENWYDDVDLDFDILIDNEQQASDVLANNTWQVIQALSANPTVLQNPVIRTLIYDYAEKVGINPAKLETMDALAPQQPQQVNEQQA